jgi:5-methyltetrahydropteroyltriglutamate--homocysteine methyltransferase
MRLSTDRILTTHVGSMPRPQALVDVLLRKDHGEACDPAESARVIHDAVGAVVRRQVEAGVDVPSDGEASKVSYATYMMDRLTGFGGDNRRKVALDLAPYPEFREKMSRMTGAQAFRRASCIGPVAVKDLEPLAADIDNMRAAMAAAGVGEGFMNAASPGLVTAFQPNQFYASHEDYIWALSDAMRREYRMIVDAGLILQLDCPDLAMARHTGFQDLSEAEFLARAELHVEAMNAALEGIPAERVRFHVCWGNYEGPHDFDIDLAKILPVILKAKPQGILFEAANPRHAHEWAVWAGTRLPEDKVLIPGLIDTSSNYVEHPELVAQGIERFAAIVGRERVLAGSDCGFGTFAGYGKLDGEIAYKKLEALAEGAAIASRRLWAQARATARSS